MDKICRGSAIGDAHNQGSWGDVTSHVDTARNARGTHICGTSFKLENAGPPGKFSQHARSRNTSDTFKTQDWFRHDAAASANDMRSGQPPPQFSPRYGKGHVERASDRLNSPRVGELSNSLNSPRGLTGRSKSQKSLKEADGVAAAPRQPGGLGVQRAKSVGLLGMQLEQDDVEVSVFDGTRSPQQRSPRSPRGPSSSLPAGMPVPRGRALDMGDEDYNPGKARSRSPTFQASENWMAYSSGAGQKEAETPVVPRDRCNTAELMPSGNWGSKMKRQHSGKIMQESENWAPLGPRLRSEFAAEPAPPSPIANAVNHIVSKGKKTNLPKNPDEAKRRLQLDTSQPEFRRSERKHAFPESAQCQRQMEEFKLSPRLATAGLLQGPPRGPDGNVETSRRQGIVDVQHRTSAEMGASMMPDQVESANLEQRKYMVGGQIVSWANCGRRGAPECFQTTARVAAQVSMEAGGIQAVPPHSLHSVRDHRNSDLLREHLKSHSPKWQEQLTVAPQMMPQQPGPARNSPPLVSVAGIATENRTYTYGDVSCLPSTMPKDTAYLQSGLKVYKYGARTPGYFSPHMPHSQIIY